MSQHVFIVGAGRVGTALAVLLRRGDVPLIGIWSRSPEGARRATSISGAPCSHGAFPAQIAAADTVILAVRDQVVPAVAGALLDAGLLRGSRVILHCGGMLPARQALSPLAAAYATGTMHPLVAVSEPRQAVRAIPGAFFALEGDPPAVHVAQNLVEAMGARSLRLTAEEMALYHAAAVITSNHSVALWHVARRLLIQTGLDPDLAGEALMGLVHSTVENVARQGLPHALTGPVRRGDVETVRRHLAVLGARAPDLVALYRACTRAAVQATRETADGASQDQALAAIEQLVKSD